MVRQWTSCINMEQHRTTWNKTRLASSNTIQALRPYHVTLIKWIRPFSKPVCRKETWKRRISEKFGTSTYIINSYNKLELTHFKSKSERLRKVKTQCDNSGSCRFRSSTFPRKCRFSPNTLIALSPWLALVTFASDQNHHPLLILFAAAWVSMCSFSPQSETQPLVSLIERSFWNTHFAAKTKTG